MDVPEHLKRKPDESFDDYHIRLFANRENYEIDRYTITNLLNKEAGTNYGESKWRKEYSMYVRWLPYFNRKKEIDIQEIKNQYKGTVEINSDGSHKSDKLIAMSAEDSKDPEFLLKAHGYNPDEWKVTNAKSSIWNQHNRIDGTLTLYASKITVKPLDNEFNIDRLISRLEELEPVAIENTLISDTETSGMLEIPLFDTHFGISDYNYYKETQHEIISKIREKQRDEIVLVVGQDMLHNDGFTGQTTRGTIIEQVDMEKAWEDASLFYSKIIEESLKNSHRVKIYYSPGNHDEAISWAFVKYLKAKYPQCEYDDSLEEHKLHVYGDNAIGFTHGDKGGQRARNEMHNVFSALFPVEWGNAKNREIHMGHFHREDAQDKFGTMVRTLATKNKTDEWHKRHGFVGATKRFMLFEYEVDGLQSIYYV